MIPHSGSSIVLLRRLALFYAAIATSATASTIISTDTGPGGGWNGNAAAAQGWTQTSSYTNVTISAEINTGQTPGAIGDAYLTNQIGTGTTTANQIAATAYSVTGANNAYSDVTLFTGLTLGPGTYYLVITSPDYNTTSNGEGWELDLSSGVADTGVALMSAVNTYPNSGIQTYAPADSFTGNIGGNSYDFSVTAEPTAATPEPAPLACLIAAVGLGAVLRRKRLARNAA